MANAAAATLMAIATPLYDRLVIVQVLKMLVNLRCATFASTKTDEPNTQV